MKSSKPISVVLVEDDPGDQKLIKNALINLEMVGQVCMAESGEEALGYLQRCKNGDVQSPWPDLILLDLNMPGMSGKEFLKYIKADEDFCAIPVVVITCSDLDADVQQCYELRAAGYIQKSDSAEEFQETMAKLIKYWTKTSLLVEK